MNTFTYDSKYSTYDNCYFQTGYYENGNLAVEIWSSEEGPITKVTVNPDVPIMDDKIAVKNYSENDGMVEWLIQEGLIENDPVQIIRSGFVEIPVYSMTQKMVQLIK